MKNSTGKTFDFQTLADDLCEVQRIYASFFSGLSEADWERPVKGAPKEWNLHETVAHLCALNGDGLESIQCALQREPYVFEGLSDRTQFNSYNRRGIEEHLPLPTEELCAELLEILGQAANISRNLLPAQAEMASEMPIYNRPVKIIEGLSIIMFHVGLHHTAQVAEPAGVPPLWMQLSPEIRHRVIGRVMRALSLLYRHDLGGDLRAVIAFRVDGPGGDNWYVDVSPESCTSGEGPVDDPSLTIHLRETDVFCKMFTGRLNLPLALLSGQMKLHGNLLLFTRFGSLFKVDGKE
ncbi:MAG TPA: SCP2 sterol-binding domain-containing protein [Anaerolineales bacterium]|nr:SCP2 sterol-binding domain-containing protein [Anaerolineales bacterium]